MKRKAQRHGGTKTRSEMRFASRMFSILGLFILGCSSQSGAPPTVAPQPDPKTATSDYWLAKPSLASAFANDYDRLWDTCSDVARDRLFDLDRQDYRDGLLTTRAMISGQFFEPWRADCGDAYEVLQSSLQTIRRSIHFEFNKIPGGYVVTPKVVVERLAQLTVRITSAAQYSHAFTGTPPLAHDAAEEAARAALEDSTQHWYAIGRDFALEDELAKEIQKRIGG
jgi:hypothetical protein